MSGFCIVTPIADKLKQAVSDNADVFRTASPEERRKFFEEYSDKETSKQINASFEKALISKQKGALKAWATRTFKVEAKKNGGYTSVIDKINSLEDSGVLGSTAFYEDLVTDQLGLSITEEQAKQLSEKGKKVEDLKSKFTSDIGQATEIDEKIAYGKARKDLYDYMDSLNPSSNLRIATEVIGRATMLASFKSPLLNIESNTVNGIAEGIVRRLETLEGGSLMMKGLNGDLARKQHAYVIRFYKETGLDVSRMMDLNFDRKTLGEERVHSEGKGIVRKYGQVMTDVVFDNLMTLPDVAFSGGHFVDSANLQSTLEAKRLGFKGDEVKSEAAKIFQDASSIEPKTPEGQRVRSKAMQDAMQGTFTNNSNYSKFSLKLRQGLNEVSGDYRLGDQLMPFVKTPANVVGTTIDYSGVLFPADVVVRLTKGIQGALSGDKAAFRSQIDRAFVKRAIRAGIGYAVAFILTSWLKPDDFIGEYPTNQKEQELLKARKAKANSIKVGNVWISLDYLGPLAAPVVGMMYARKYGNNFQSALASYAVGFTGQVSRVPGLSTIKDIADFTYNYSTGKIKADDVPTAMVNYATDFIRARTIPALVSDIGKAIDPNERQVEKGNWVESVQSALPVWRQQLPEKKNTFGETIKSEPWYSTLFAGARISTNNDSAVVNEMVRLSQANQLPAITDIEKTSPRVGELKAQIGDKKFDEAKQYFADKTRAKYEQVISSPLYAKLPDDKKKKYLDKIKDANLELMLYKYHYKKVKK